jgi:hypothetical protein
VVVWVTNNPAIHNFVKRNLFPRWRVQYVATHYWLKVPRSSRVCLRPTSSRHTRVARHHERQLTTGGEPVIPLRSTHRKPYGIFSFPLGRGAAFFSKNEWLCRAFHRGLPCWPLWTRHSATYLLSSRAPSASAVERLLRSVLHNDLPMQRSSISCARRWWCAASPTAMPESLCSMVASASCLCGGDTKSAADPQWLWVRVTDVLGLNRHTAVRRLELFARNMQPGWTSWGGHNPLLCIADLIIIVN